ncbi:MAG: endonuclease III [Candidatus Woesearchaeota archaeon]|nr:MAG: endonuclease III [Candidatus Woesearchaeota archaeon]
MKPVNIAAIYNILKKEVPNYKVPVVELIKIKSKSPFNVLVGALLSARTKDEVTTLASKKLFEKVKKPEDFNKLTKKQIQSLIYPVGFYKTKAKHLKQLPKVLEEKFNNKIPQTVEELIELPGVGRKTANLVLAVGFNKPAIAVDVHVNRIMNRLGYVKTKTPLETEMTLRKKLPIKYWEKLNYFLVAFGQNLCRPVSPKCSICPIRKHCNRVGVVKSR